MSKLLKRIHQECSEFIDRSKGNYAEKPLMFDGRFIKRVRVRKKKNKDNDLYDLFDEAFNKEYKDIMGRSIFCNGIHTTPVDEREQFYVFPINGFKILYNPAIDYCQEYENIYRNLQNTMDTVLAKQTFIDMIEYSYKENEFDLADALFSNNEIIFYGIPYFFAIKKDKHPDYRDLLKMISNTTHF